MCRVGACKLVLLVQVGRGTRRWIPLTNWEIYVGARGVEDWAGGARRTSTPELSRKEQPHPDRAALSQTLVSGLVVPYMLYTGTVLSTSETLRIYYGVRTHFGHFEPDPRIQAISRLYCLNDPAGWTFLFRQHGEPRGGCVRLGGANHDVAWGRAAAQDANLLLVPAAMA